MKKVSIITQCEQLIRDVINGFALKDIKRPFHEYIVKALKFKKSNDWNQICSLLDLLGDTEDAKENFEKYGITGPTKFKDNGEMYLRLYGILNSIYLQKSAVIEFLELVNIKEKKEFKIILNQTKILQIRHIAGAHTLDFISNGIITSHQIAQHSLESGIIKTLDSLGNFQEFDLISLISDFNKIANEILIKATEKFISTVFKSSKEKKSSFSNKLNLIKLQFEGHWVIETEDIMNPIVVKFSK
ncbi:hypothetical protein [Aquirufa salirivi]|uniref:Uncharacterized protein n=1 Tax=Aquirufa salirivi TaxID=3104729 RepID=A0ABW8RW86_9BACT